MGARASRDEGNGLGKGATGAETGAAGPVVTLMLAGAGEVRVLEGIEGRADGMAEPAMDMALDS
jgi:hypothetical protein